MMTMWAGVLAQDDGDGIETIFWVIAFLILSAVGALSEKLKRKKEESARHWKPTKVEPPSRPARRAPPRPVRPAQRGEPAAPSVPPPRPVPRRPVAPRPPTQVRPQPQVQTDRYVQPTIRRKQETRRRVPGRRQARSVERTKMMELAAQLEQRVQTTMSKTQPIELGLAETELPTEVKAPPSRLGPGLTTPVRSMTQMSIRELRLAIVLSEVLRPPLALRDLQ